MTDVGPFWASVSVPLLQDLAKFLLKEATEITKKVLKRRKLMREMKERKTVHYDLSSVQDEPPPFLKGELRRQISFDSFKAQRVRMESLRGFVEQDLKILMELEKEVREYDPRDPRAYNTRVQIDKMREKAAKDISDLKVVIEKIYDERIEFDDEYLRMIEQGDS